jgi:NADH:ubiquinone oxidoreductase subunit H
MAEAESELVAGFMTEYGSMGFGLFMMGEYLNIVVVACLTTVLFLGGWDCPLGLIPGVWWFLVKIYLLIFTYHLDTLDFPTHPDLPTLESELENTDPILNGEPADHSGSDQGVLI